MVQRTPDSPERPDRRRRRQRRITSKEKWRAIKDPPVKFTKDNPNKHGFWNDPALVAPGVDQRQFIYGELPLHHPRRCHGKKNRSNPPIRCGRHALHGAYHCQYHGGARYTKRGDYSVDPSGRGFGKNWEMHSYYSKATGPILREKLAELARLSPDERHSLQGEIDLSRTMAERALRLYEAACFPDESKQEVDPKTGKIKAASEGAKAASQQNLVEALNFVGNLVSRASKVHAVNTATVDVEQLEYIVLQVTRIIEEEVADYDKAMADRVVERMRDIRMPERSAAGGTPQELAQQLRDAAGHIEKGMEAEDDDEEKSDA